MDLFVNVRTARIRPVLSNRYLAQGPDDKVMLNVEGCNWKVHVLIDKNSLGPTSYLYLETNNGNFMTYRTISQLLRSPVGVNSILHLPRNRCSKDRVRWVASRVEFENNSFVLHSGNRILTYHNREHEPLTAEEEEGQVNVNENHYHWKLDFQRQNLLVPVLVPELDNYNGWRPIPENILIIYTLTQDMDEGYGTYEDLVWRHRVLLRRDILDNRAKSITSLLGLRWFGREMEHTVHLHNPYKNRFDLISRVPLDDGALRLLIRPDTYHGGNNDGNNDDTEQHGDEDDDDTNSYRSIDYEDYEPRDSDEPEPDFFP